MRVPRLLLVSLVILIVVAFSMGTTFTALINVPRSFAGIMTLPINIPCSIPASISITPRTFNVKSANGGGSVTVHFEDGLPAGFTSENVHLMEMRVVLGGGHGERVINALPHPPNESAGIAKFSSEDLVYLLDGMTGEITLKVSGAAGGCDFAGRDTITVISPGGGPQGAQDAGAALAPGGDEALEAGAEDLPLVEDSDDPETADTLDESTEDENQSDPGNDEDAGNDAAPDGDSGASDPQPDEQGQDDSEHQENDGSSGRQDRDATDDGDEEQRPDPDGDGEQQPDTRGGDDTTSGGAPPSPPVEDVEPADERPDGSVGDDEETEVSTPSGGDQSGGQAPAADGEVDDGPVKEPLTPVPPQEPVKVNPPMQPIEDGNPYKPDDLPSRGGFTENDSGAPQPSPDTVDDDPPPAEVDSTPPVDEHEGSDDEPGDSQPPETEPEPVVTCPIEAEIQFDLEEIDLAEDGRSLRVTVALPDDLPETYAIDLTPLLTVQVELGPGEYGPRSVEALPVSGSGRGVYEISANDLRLLLGDHRGEVTLDVRGTVNACEFAGSDELRVIETVVEPEDEPVVEEPAELEEDQPESEPEPQPVEPESDSPEPGTGEDSPAETEEPDVDEVKEEEESDSGTEEPASDVE